MPTKEPIYLIDGNAYIYRAYHAITPLSNDEGIPTHATYGFTNIINRVIKEKNPGFLAIAFDAKGPTFRHEIYDQYKGNRPPMPDDLVVQLPYIRKIVAANNILTFEQIGVEADDLLASAALSLAQQGHHVILVSGDKDLLQLVSPQISMWEPMKDVLMDEAYILKKYGVDATQLNDLFALMGDKSDNVPGVPGVGPKTASKLISEFKTIESIYQNLERINGKKLKENLKTNKDMAFLSRKLIALKTDLDVPESHADYRLQKPDAARLAELYLFLGFTRLQQTTKEIIPIDTQNFTLVSSKEQLEAMVPQLQESPFLVIDTETTSLDPLTAEIVGISLCTPDISPCYIPVSHQNQEGKTLPNQLGLDEIKTIIEPLLTASHLPKVGHNLKYDLAILANNNFNVSGPLWDTMIASYLIDPVRRSHKLDTLTQELLSLKMTSFAEVTHQSKKADAFRFVALTEAKNYSCEDAACTLALWQRFEPELDRLNLWPLFNHVETPLIPILAEMEKTGVAINCDLLQELSTDFGIKLNKLSTQIFTLAGEEFNINSPKQLAEILFEKLDLPKGRKTKTGYSTDIKVLEKLAASHELPALIIEHRNLAKLKSTYVDKIPKMVHPKTGRIHTSFNQTVTATGRLSSSEPNLQNIPIRNQEGQRIREAFIPAPGHKFIAADYSQIDLRVLAHYSKDPALVEAFCGGLDIHSQTAAEIFRIDQNFVTNQMRRVAKSINFGIVYGMSAFGLANQLKISRKEAATFIKRYFAHFHGVKKFMEEIIEQAKKDGFVTTLLGRRRHLPDINSSNKTRREFAERTALNTPIQGTAADIIKMAAIKTERLLVEQKLKAKMILQIHDELILETPIGEIEQVKQITGEAMESVLDLEVPLAVNISIGDSLAKI